MSRQIDLIYGSRRRAAADREELTRVSPSAGWPWPPSSCSYLGRIRRRQLGPVFVLTWRTPLDPAASSTTVGAAPPIGPWSVGGRGGCGWPRLPFYRFLPWPDPPTGSDPPVSSTAWRQDDPAEPPPPPTEPPHPAFHTASGHPTPLALAFVSRCLAPWRTMLVVPVDRGGGKQERDKGVGWVSILCT